MTIMLFIIIGVALGGCSSNKVKVEDVKVTDLSESNGPNIPKTELVYTFKIRQGVTFSDGEICDANAIKANFDAIVENKDRHTWLEMMHLLVDTEVVDEYTFRISLTDSYYPMLTELGVTRPFAMISPKAMKDGSTKDGVNEYIGTGPYILKDFVTDEYAIFEANENYWGEKPTLKKITVKVIPDNQTRILALEKGEIDLIYGKNMIDADVISKYENDEKFDVALSEPTSTRQIVINTSNDILKDKELRKAFQHATNRQAISEGIFYGLEAPADTLFSKTVPYSDIDLEPYEYDLEKANHILEQAGWLVGSTAIREKDGNKLEVSLLYNSDSVTEKTIAEYLQSEYEKVGIAINIVGQYEGQFKLKNYVIKRILISIPLLIGISFLCFSFINLIPSDPAEVALRVRQVPIVTEEAIESMREELGLDDPFLVRYARWVGASLKFDFGVSYTNPSRTVLGEIKRCLPATLKLAGFSLIFVIGLSLPIGFLSAVYKDTWFDRIIRGIVFLTTAMPVYWVGLILIWIVSIKLDWLPTSGNGGIRHLILPSITVSLTYISTYVRLIRNNMLENMKEDYV